MVERRLAAVRPYEREDHIRKRVFAHVAAAGLRIEEKDIIAPGTSDDEALALMAKCHGHAFLVPFHAHRDAEGRQINGLKLIRRFHEACPELAHNPILMPCTETSYQVVRASLPSALARRVLLIAEKTLDDPEIGQRIRAHVEPFFARLEREKARR